MSINDGYVRVSTILARFKDYSHIDQEVLQNKALIGTNVHQAIVDNYDGEFKLFKTQRAQAYYESYEMWQKENTKTIKQVPRLYCGELMLTGECDGLYGDNHIIDWKCSSQADAEIWNMQAHFYWYLLKQNGYTPSNTMTWVNLRQKKTIRRDPKTKLGEAIYYPLEPIEYKFTFDEKVLSKCLDEVIKYWEEKYCALAID